MSLQTPYLPPFYPLSHIIRLELLNVILSSCVHFPASGISSLLFMGGWNSTVPCIVFSLPLQLLMTPGWVPSLSHCEECNNKHLYASTFAMRFFFLLVLDRILLQLFMWVLEFWTHFLMLENPLSHPLSLTWVWMWHTITLKSEEEFVLFLQSF